PGTLETLCLCGHGGSGAFSFQVDSSQAQTLRDPVIPTSSIDPPDDQGLPGAITRGLIAEIARCAATHFTFIAKYCQSSHGVFLIRMAEAIHAQNEHCHPRFFATSGYYEVRVQLLTNNQV